MNQHEDLNRLRNLASLMDSKFKLPFGLRVGWDGILGFIPGVGDLITNSFSFYIVYRAAMIGCSPAIILRMGINLLIDNVLDAIPFFGNFADFFWKANNRNMALVERFMIDPRGTKVSSRFVVFLSLLFVASLLAGVILLLIWGTIQVWNFLFSQPAPWI